MYGTTFLTSSTMDELKAALIAKDEDRIRDVLNKIRVIQQIDKMLQVQGISILAELCKLGLTDLMQIVTDRGIDIIEANKQVRNKCTYMIHCECKAHSLIH